MDIGKLMSTLSTGEKTQLRTMLNAEVASLTAEDRIIAGRLGMSYEEYATLSKEVDEQDRRAQLSMDRAGDVITGGSK